MPIFKRLLFHFFDCYTLYRCQLDNLSPDEIKIDKRFEYKPVERDDIDKYSELIEQRGGQRYLEIMEDRLRNENESVAGLAILDRVTDQIAYLCWLSFSTIYVDELRRHVEIGSEEAYLLDDYTLPEFRRRRLHKYMMRKRLEYCRDRGKSEALITIMCFNTPAIRTIEELGFEKMRTRVFFKKGSIRNALRKLLFLR